MQNRLQNYFYGWLCENPSDLLPLLLAFTCHFQSEDFFSVVEAHNGQPLRLYVYNSTTDKCREVTLIPNLSWGGDGMLGCEIGFGYLHRIPPPPGTDGADSTTKPVPTQPAASAHPPGHQPSGYLPAQQPMTTQQPPRVSLICLLDVKGHFSLLVVDKFNT